MPSFVQPKIGAGSVLAGALAKARDEGWLLREVSEAEKFCVAPRCRKFRMVNSTTAQPTTLAPRVWNHGRLIGRVEFRVSGFAFRVPKSCCSMDAPGRRGVHDRIWSSKEFGVFINFSVLTRPAAWGRTGHAEA